MPPRFRSPAGPRVPVDIEIVAETTRAAAPSPMESIGEVAAKALWPAHGPSFAPPPPATDVPAHVVRRGLDANLFPCFKICAGDRRSRFDPLDAFSVAACHRARPGDDAVAPCHDAAFLAACLRRNVVGHENPLYHLASAYDGKTHPCATWRP